MSTIFFSKIDEYDDYTVFSDGTIRNDKTNKFLKQSIVSGYKVVSLYKDKKLKTYYVHRLMAINLLPNPFNYTHIDHKNRNKLDNSIYNLRWVNASQNRYNTDKMKNMTSKYRCVYKNKNDKYVVSIVVDKRRVYGGCFKNEDKAGEKVNELIIKFNLDKYIDLNIIL